jgi:hypothetical protein
VDYKIPLLIKIWDGGLNSKAQPTDLPFNESPSLDNIWTDDYGSISTIPGYVTFATSLGTAPIDGLHSFGPVTGSPYLVAVCNNSVFYSTAQSAITGASFISIPSAQSIFTSGQDVRCLTTEGKILLVNGDVPAYKWDSVYWTRFGVVPPTLNVALSTAFAAGPLTGTYSYWATNVNSAGVESNYSLMGGGSLLVTSADISISGITTMPASYGVNSINIYRNTAAAQAGDVPWFVGQIANGVTAFVDSKPDSALVAQPPLDHGLMPNAKYVVDANGYLFASGNVTYPQRLYWSKQGIREAWPAVNFIDVGLGDGQPITGLSVFGTTLAIHKNDGYGNGRIWLLYMPDTSAVSDPTNWSLMGSPAYFSTQSDKTLTFANHLVYYLNRTGWYAFSGQDLAQSAADGTLGKFTVNSQSFNIEPNILSLNNETLPKAAAINFNNKIFVAVPFGVAQLTNNKIYIYDYMIASQPDHVMGSWFTLDGPPSNCLENHAGNLLAGSSVNDGQIYQLLTGVNFNGSAINSYYWTPEITGVIDSGGNQAHRDYVKVWRWLDVTYETAPYILTITYFNDAETAAGQIDTIDMSSTTTFWGGSFWGSTTWSSGQARATTRIVLRGSVSKKIQFKFSTNATGAHFKIHDITLRYTVKGVR